jgi:hypothetical protein
MFFLQPTYFCDKVNDNPRLLHLILSLHSISLCMLYLPALFLEQYYVYMFLERLVYNLSLMGTSLGEILSKLKLEENEDLHD